MVLASSTISGTKGLLEDQAEEATLLPSADYTLCLDSLLSPESQELYLHVSKPPKEGTRQYEILQALNQVIKLADTQLQFGELVFLVP